MRANVALSSGQRSCEKAARRVGAKFNEALGPRQQAAGPTNVQQPAMALTMSAPVHVDSGRATVHWHNEHDKAPEATRRLADPHEVAQDVLCHELRALEVRYGRLEGLIQRLVGLVQRDCPATLMEFMERR